MLIVAAAIGLLATSCSDDDGGTAPNTVEPSVTGAPGPTDPTTVSTDPPATTASTTTSDAPTTTVDPAIALAEVEAAYRVIWERAILALQNPTDPGLVADALALRTGPANDFLAARLEQFRSEGRAGRPNNEIPAALTVEQAESLNGSTDLARLVVCELDSGILVEIGTGPNGTDTVIDDNIYAYREEITLQRDDEIWRVIGVVRLGEWTGEATCPAAS